ncbi:MAG: SpoVR family protein [Bacteroidales bacterium]|nr:SpoVR family protein [Bacteroidales bacterium]
MELIDQRTKKIMEECKVRARDAGLSFDNETLEYIVTNKDMVDLSPKVMIPTLYDYWVHDVEVLKGHGKYKLYPNNPYETVINSRPAISFYNDNNPDWMNIMIFYHVLAHIDFFQNNKMFENTWNDDFVGKALADKRLIANLRSEHGRWVDYVIEFSRSIDNIVGYFDYISALNYNTKLDPTAAITFYFDVFLQEIVKVPGHEIFKEIERYNNLRDSNKEQAESLFFSEVKSKYPEFQAKFEKHSNKREKEFVDVLQFIHDNSPFLRKESNSWMKLVMNVVRNTSLYFQPQIRTKIINEGWASYWHDKLFRSDPRIAGHEIGYAKLNAGVTALRRVGLNPYAIGLRLIEHVENLANKGQISRDFQVLDSFQAKENFDRKTGKGQETIFELRKHFSDFTLINSYVSQDFVDEHNLFVVGQHLDQSRNVIQYYVKSRKAADYKKMLIDSLYHPPRISVNKAKTSDENLYMVHHFEGKQLIQQFVPDTLLGLEFLWGGQVQLETTDIVVQKPQNQNEKPKYELRKVLYTIKDKKVTKQNL